MVDGMKLLKYHVHDSTTRIYIYIYLCDVQSIQSDMVGDDERVTRLKLRPTRTVTAVVGGKDVVDRCLGFGSSVRVGLSFSLVTLSSSPTMSDWTDWTSHKYIYIYIRVVESCT